MVLPIMLEYSLELGHYNLLKLYSETPPTGILAEL